jgi:hypothetical protein
MNSQESSEFNEAILIYKHLNNARICYEFIDIMTLAASAVLQKLTLLHNVGLEKISEFIITFTSSPDNNNNFVSCDRPLVRPEETN